MAESLDNWLQQQLGSTVVARQRVSGGDFAEAACVELADGERVFVKTHRNPPDNFFSTEATGLKWLRDADTVNVPAVLAVSDEQHCLVMEWIEPGAGTVAGDQRFGAALAGLHQSDQGFDGFGRADGRTTGSLALPNHRAPDWVTFYRERRLLPLMQIAEHRDSLPASTLARLGRLIERLDTLDIPEQVSSLIHGDLWAGNRICDRTGESWLIDPAAQWTSREFEIAMMHLFGGYSQDCMDAYNEAYPLESGWQQRIALHQLAPLVVHAIKFGGSYVSATANAIDQYL